MSSHIPHTYPYGTPFISGPPSMVSTIDFDKIYSDVNYPKNILQCKFINCNTGDEKIIDMYAPKIIFNDVTLKDYHWVICSLQRT